MCGLRVVHRRRCGAGRIFLPDDVAQTSGHGGSLLGGVLLADFVADAPHDHRRVIAIAADPGAHVLLVPVAEDQVEVERRLPSLPDVEQLVHDEKAHAVRQVEQLGGGRIVGHADRVRTHLAEDLQLPLGGAGVERRAERAEVVVLVDALDDDALAVDEETLVRVEAESPDAKGRVVAVDRAAPAARPSSRPRSGWDAESVAAPTAAARQSSPSRGRWHSTAAQS